MINKYEFGPRMEIMTKEIIEKKLKSKSWTLKDAFKSALDEIFSSYNEPYVDVQYIAQLVRNHPKEAIEMIYEDDIKNNRWRKMYWCEFLYRYCRLPEDEFFEKGLNHKTKYIRDLFMEIKEENESENPALTAFERKLKMYGLFGKEAVTKLSAKNLIKKKKELLINIYCSGYSWNVDTFKRTFIDDNSNIDLLQSVLWGIYDESEELKCAFAYSNGNFLDCNNEEVLLKGKIGIVHPIELTKEEIKYWKKTFKDNKVKFLFGQLSLKVENLTNEEKKLCALDRYYENTATTLSTILTCGKWGLIRKDWSGVFHSYRLTDPVHNVEVILTFDKMLSLPEYGQDKHFLRYVICGKLHHTSDVLYEFISPEDRIEAGKMPKRLISSALAIFNTFAHPKEETYEYYDLFTNDLLGRGFVKMVVDSSMAITEYNEYFNKKISKELKFELVSSETCKDELFEITDENCKKDIKVKEIEKGYYDKLIEIFSNLTESEISISLYIMDVLSSTDLENIMNIFEKHLKLGGTINECILYVNSEIIINKSRELMNIIKKYSFVKIGVVKNYIDEKTSDKEDGNSVFEMEIKNLIKYTDVSFICTLKKNGVNDIGEIKKYIKFVHDLGQCDIVFRSIPICKDKKFNFLEKNKVALDKILEEVSEKGEYIIDSVEKDYYSYQYNYEYKNNTITFVIEDYDKKIQYGKGEEIRNMVYDFDSNLYAHYNNKLKIF